MNMEIRAAAFLLQFLCIRNGVHQGAVFCMVHESPGRLLRTGSRSTPGQKEKAMETRIAVIAIIVDDRSRSEEVNQLLHEYGEYIVGRMGVPYHKKQISVISIILDAPQEKISALSGKLGMIKGISTKTVYSKIPKNHEMEDSRNV